MDKQIAYSTMVIKAVDEDKREFTGIASTPEPDRINDVMIPKGAKFKLPLPFLWQHDHRQPIGEITEAKVTDKGIEVKGIVKKVSAPSQLSARLDEAWVSMREGLVRGLSIGFRPIKYAFLDNGGTEYEEWDWFELSAVTIPMSAESSITSVKSFDTQIRESMLGKDEIVKKTSEATEKKSKTVKLTPKEGKKMSIAEKLKGFKDERAAKQKKLEDMMEKSMEAGETFDDAQQEEYDTLEAEVKALNGHIEKAERLLASKAKTATLVSGGEDEDDDDPAAKAKAARQGQKAAVRVKQMDNAEKGIGFARLARVKALAFTRQLSTTSELEIAQKLYPNDEKLISGIQKTAVPAASTLDAPWAGNLINEGGVAFADFVEYLRPRTLYGQISGRFRSLPFDTPVLVQGSGGTAKWVKEGVAKPLTEWTYTRTKLTPLKVAAIAAATKETLMRASVSADALLRDELARAVGARIDATLISADPYVADESPAGLLNGVTPLTLTGDGTVAGIRCDIAQFLKEMVEGTKTLNGAFWVMPETVAIALSLATNEVGAPAFTGITPTGGTLAGLPVFTSEYVPVDSDGPVVALIKGDEIFLGDEGGVQVSISDQASLVMDDAPAMNSTAPTAAQLVSMWQTNSVAFLVERFLNFQKRRSQAVVYANVDWDLCAVS